MEPAVAGDLVTVVVAAGQGDRAAAEELVTRTQGFLFRLAYGVLGDYHRSQDALQECYLACLPRLRQLRRPEAVLTWLARSLTRICWRARPRAELQLDEAWAAPDLPEDRSLEAASLATLLAGLTATERTVLVLRHLLELSYEEMAEVLEVPIGTVRSRLSAARRRLERSFTP